jgi:hypothetical protein
MGKPKTFKFFILLFLTLGIFTKSATAEICFCGEACPHVFTNTSTLAQVPSDFKYHILGCTEFEILCEFLKNHPDNSLVDVLSLREDNPNYYNMGFNEMLQTAYGFECYRSELIWEASRRLRSNIAMGNMFDHAK